MTCTKSTLSELPNQRRANSRAMSTSNPSSVPSLVTLESGGASKRRPTRSLLRSFTRAAVEIVLAATVAVGGLSAGFGVAAIPAIVSS